MPHHSQKCFHSCTGYFSVITHFKALCGLSCALYTKHFLRIVHDIAALLLQSAKMELQANSAAATLASVKTKSAPKAKPSKPAAEPKEPADATTSEDTGADTETVAEAEAADDSMAEVPEAGKAGDISGKDILFKRSPLQVHYWMLDDV